MPQSIYVVQVFFKERQVTESEKKKKKKDKKSKDTKSTKVHEIILEKVYSDFQRLHEHITNTIYNEIEEHSRYTNLLGQEQNDYELEGRQASRLLTTNFDISNKNNVGAIFNESG